MISIVTSYYNRKKQFYETLKSITKTKHKDFELIVVDDGSSPEQRLEEYLITFPFLKIIRIEPKDKWYVNSCVPFNIGINVAKGDIIMLQCPECLHVHDILTHINERINENNYI
jgi:glycosyltransferase involved in cell wall biosynthesis